MQDDIDMEPLHKLFIYRKKLVKPYIERLLKWMDGITYMMSALFILTLVYEHGSVSYTHLTLPTKLEV